MSKDKAPVLGMYARCELTGEDHSHGGSANGNDHAHNNSNSATVVRSAARLVAKHLFDHATKQVTERQREAKRRP